MVMESHKTLQMFPNFQKFCCFPFSFTLMLMVRKVIDTPVDAGVNNISDFKTFFFLMFATIIAMVLGWAILLLS